MLKKITSWLVICFAPSFGLAHATDILNVSLATAGQYEIHYAVPFGSLQDSVPGLAHVLEHLKFAYGGPHSMDGLKAIEGSAAGASTTYRYTQYEVSVTAEHVVEALQTLSQVAGPLPINEAELMREKQVVSQELIERQNADPDGPFFEAFTRKLLDGTPYAALPGGTLETLAAVTMDDVAKFNTAHYEGSNGFLVIAGPPLPKELGEAVKATFPNSKTAVIEIDEQRQAKIQDDGLGSAPVFLPEVASFAVVPDHFRIDGTSSHVNSTRLVFSKLFAASETWPQSLAAAIVQSAMNSRLPEGLTDVISEDAGLVQDFQISIDDSLPNVVRLDFSANLTSGVSVEQVISAYQAWLTKLSNDGLSEKTFNRVKSRFFLHDEWDDAEARLHRLSLNTSAYGFSKASTERATLQDLKLEDANNFLKLFAQNAREGIAVLQPKGANP